MLSFLLILITGTLVIAGLGWMMWKRALHWTVPFGLLIIYFWTIYGSWFFLFDEYTGRAGMDFGLHYYYIFDKMFTVRADEYYFQALIYYLLFIIFLQITFLLLAPAKTEIKKQSETIRYGRLLFLSLVCMIIGFLIIYPDIRYAFEIKDSIYRVTRKSTNRFFTIHQLCNLVAVFSSLYGFTRLLMESSKKDSAKAHKILWLVYPLLIFLVITYMLMFGNKHELFFTGIFMILFFLIYSVRIEVKRLALLVSIIAIPLMFNDTLRRYSPENIIDFVSNKEPSGNGPSAFSSSSVATSVLFSNEMFFAHFSMYGVLKHHTPVTYGSSIKSMAASVIPRFIWKDRPVEIYDYYAKTLMLKEGQGYTIHHATAWYLNFGLAGILLGAIVFGGFWACCFRIQLWTKLLSFPIGEIIALIAPISFISQSVFLLRNGPESYKSVIIEAIIIPALIIYFSQQKKQMQ